MVARRKHIDIDNKPDVIDLAEEIRDSGESVVSRLKGIDVAMVRSLPGTAADENESDDAQSKKAALMSLAGTWVDLDTDALVDEIYALRDSSPRRSRDW